jgi:transcriptional regulator with XRE-family HTH domain
LRLIRKARGLAQEQLSDVSGRTYLSEIERGIKNPTVEKIDELARAMDVHPLTLLTIAYLPHLRTQEVDALQSRINKETKGLLEKAEVVWPKKAR